MTLPEKGRDTGIDWEAAEQHFVTQTGPRVRFREYAAMAHQYPWSGHTEVAYTTLKDIAKAGMWLKKRAEWIREHNPGLLQDAELIYTMLVDKYIDGFDDATMRDMAAAAAQIARWQELIMVHQAPEDAIDDRELVTRDEILDFMTKYSAPTDEQLLDEAAEIVAEETPV